MKTLKSVSEKIIVIILCVTLFTACGKTGPAGPQGTAGTPGEQGTNGTNGDKGAKGDKGTTGPRGATGTSGAMGPRGATGPRGVTGVTGPKGDKGDPGSGIVVASGWLGFACNILNDTAVKITSYTISDFDMDRVEETTLDNFFNHGGVILVYGHNYGLNINPLFNYEHGKARYSYAYVGANTLYITIRSVNGNDLDAIYYNTPDNRFRVALIPAGVQIGNRSSSPSPDYKDYYAVCKYYGIPE